MRPILPLLALLALAACRTKPEPEDTGPVDTGPENVDLDADGYASDVDCDDTDAAIHPDAPETCDGRDEDCDGEVDEGLLATWYTDADGDGWGEDASAVETCAPASDQVAQGGDCDDADAAVHPEAAEVCDDLDNDCDGEVDEGLLATWYTDADGDGGGDDATAVESSHPASDQVAAGGDCDDADAAFHPGAAEDDSTDPNDYNCDGSTGWADADADGWAACRDCDDADATVHPEADEVCNGADDDCDGAVDEDALDALIWFDDDDGDGYGDPASTTTACDQPTGYTDDATDCDDADPAVNPGAVEVCNGTDDDCSGTIDDDYAADAPTWYADGDGDGYGDASRAQVSCTGDGASVRDATDCDDTDPAVNPAATEVCNGIDDDCSGVIDDDYAADAPTWYADTDADGYGDARSSHVSCAGDSASVLDATDCDDADPAVNPAATEVCNGIDDDCSGVIDDDYAADAATWYADVDSDGFGDPTHTTAACTQPGGHLADDTDCDDLDPAVNPAATEACDGTDNDCDGTVDEDDAADAATWYADADADGYGDARSSHVSCTGDSASVLDATDCDDTDPAENPGATELCNGVDDDCSGTIDDDYAAAAPTWYADADADGYGDAGSSHVSCTGDSASVLDATDCDDTDPAVNPGAIEVCNGVDDDCSGTIDDDYAADAPT
ncbi:MAG: putative metal-binding motif-containing protein [Pseudomonadota bacterium]